MRIVLLLLMSFALGACATAPQINGSDADNQLASLYEREWLWRQQQTGSIRDEDDNWVSADKWPSVTPAHYATRHAYWTQILAELDEIPVAELSHEQQINAAVFRQIVTSNLSDAHFKTFEAPLNSDSFFWSYLHPQRRGYRKTSDYDRYLGRLQDLPRYFDEQIANMRAGLARGYTPPAVTLLGRDATLEPYLVSGKDNPFYIPMQHFPPNMTAQDKARIEAAAIASINADVVPAFTQLLSFMRTEYLPNARASLAANQLPDGARFYQAQIRKYTTLDLTPEEIHQQGLSEVARIRDAMLGIVDEVDFDGGLPEFFEFLRTDPQFYASTPDELMGVSAYVDKRMAAHIGDVLGFLPRKRHTISPVPDAIAPTYTAGRGGYGGCLMNTYDLPSRPLYTIPALTLHECSPGHSLQAAISREAPGEIPEFRARNYFSGYGEGWGLYTEWLGGELGIYRTPYERFGQLTYEMWRACRLVIDTGVHHYGWTRDQALAYLRDNAALSEHEVTTEIDRYISWPAQALAYKLGEMLIREKRKAAEAALGTEFDQRYFHDTILALRSVPLSVLASELDAWIAAGGPNPHEGLED